MDAVLVSSVPSLARSVATADLNTTAGTPLGSADSGLANGASSRRRARVVDRHLPETRTPGQRDPAARDPTGHNEHVRLDTGVSVRPFDRVTSRYSKVMHRSRKNLAASDCIFAVKDFANAAELTGSHRFYTVGPLNRADL